VSVVSSPSGKETASPQAGFSSLLFRAVHHHDDCRSCCLTLVVLMIMTWKWLKARMQAREALALIGKWRRRRFSTSVNWLSVIVRGELRAFGWSETLCWVGRATSRLFATARAFLGRRLFAVARGLYPSLALFPDRQACARKPWSFPA